MKSWLSPSQWARAWDLLWSPGEDRVEVMAHVFACVMGQVLEAVREIAPPDMLQKLARFSLDTGKPDKDPLGLSLETLTQPLYDSIPPKTPVAKFFQAPWVRRRRRDKYGRFAARRRRKT